MKTTMNNRMSRILGTLGLGDQGRSVAVDAGVPVTLELTENPSTGFTWCRRMVTGVTVNEAGFTPESAAIGSGGQHAWTLTARAGTWPVTLELARGREALRKFTVILVAR